MFIFKFKKQKKQNVRFTEKNVLRLLEDNRYITTAMIQRTYNVGYASAVKMIEILAKKGYIKQNGQRWVTKKNIY